MNIHFHRATPGGIADEAVRRGLRFTAVSWFL